MKKTALRIDSGIRKVAVDGACSKNPGPGQFRLVSLDTGEEIFRSSTYEKVTNNLMELMAVMKAVHRLAKWKEPGFVYSDSSTVVDHWWPKRYCKSNGNKKVVGLIDQGFSVLEKFDLSQIKVVKWNTKEWGEIPADFGNK